MIRHQKKAEIDFIGIGAQKAGTSWLYQNLKNLDQFELPPFKELHYFSKDSKYFSANVYYEKRGINFTTAKWVVYALKGIVKSLLKKGLRDANWYIGYYFATPNDIWYLRRFKGMNGLTGEITPAYAMLEIEDIKWMYSIAPDARIIFLLRNPIDRIWSQYRFSILNQTIPFHNLVDPQEMISIISRPGYVKRTTYIETIQNYLSVYPPEQFLIGFYDAIIEQPMKLLFDIVDFLGGDVSSLRKEMKLEEIINPSPPKDMPKEVEEYLIDQYKDMIAELSASLGGYASRWLTDLVGALPSDSILPPATVQLTKEVFTDSQ